MQGNDDSEETEVEERSEPVEDEEHSEQVEEEGDSEDTGEVKRDTEGGKDLGALKAEIRGKVFENYWR